MNKILFIVRMAKGLTEKEVAEELKIDENLYKEIEFLRIKKSICIVISGFIY